MITYLSYRNLDVRIDELISIPSGAHPNMPKVKNECQREQPILRVIVILRAMVDQLHLMGHQQIGM